MAGFDLATAIIEIVGDPDKFNAALKDADKKGAGFVKKMGAGFGALAKIAIPAGIIGTIGMLAKQALDAGEQINLMSQRTGVSAENLTRLTYAGGLSGVTIETVSSAMGKLARQMVKGEDEMGKGSKALQRMGISATDAKGKLRPIMDVVLDVSEAFKKMDGPQRLSASMEIFGREGGQKMIDVLAMGRDELKKLMDESDRVGYTMSTKTAQQLDTFGDYIDRANLRMQAMARVATVTLMPAIEQIGSMFADDFPGDVQDGLLNKAGYYIKRFIFGVVAGFDTIVTVVRAAFTALGYLADVWGDALSKTLAAVFADIGFRLDTVWAQIQKTWELVKKGRMGIMTETALHNLDLIKQIREENKKLWEGAGGDTSAAWDEAAQALEGARARYSQIEADMFKDMEVSLEKSLERSQRLWDAYFEEVAKASEENPVGREGGPRELTDEEKKALLAVRESIKQREIEIAQMKGQHRLVYDLKLELIKLGKQKMEIAGIDAKLIDQWAAIEARKALVEFNKASEEASRLAKGQIADMELAMAQAAGLTDQIRALSEAKIALTVAEWREKGVTEELIKQYEKLASDELNDRLKRSSEEALKKISAMHREYGYDVLEATMTEGEKARLAAKEKLEKRLDDLKAFAQAHKDLVFEVMRAETAAWEAYYAELGEIDQKYETSWRTMFRRIADEAKNQVKNTGQEMNNLAASFISIAQSSLGDMFFDAFTGNFDEARKAAKQFFSDLLREIINFLAREAVLKMVTMFVSKWGGGGASAASGATYANTWGTIGNGAVTGSISGHRAGGGMVWNRGVYELAEEGPEAVVPTRSGGKIGVELLGGAKNSSPIDLHQTIVITPEMFGAMRTSPEEVVTIVNSDYARNGQTRRTMRVRR